MTGGPPKPWLRAQTPACPVDPGTQSWIESSLCWFADQFGGEALRPDIVLPSADFLTGADYSASRQDIEAVVARVCVQMRIDPDAVELELFDGAAEKEKAARSGKRRTVGHFRMQDGRAIIALDTSESADPGLLTAIAAHELCHLRLLGERRITADRADGERLTDLLTVFFGLGIFTANAAVRFDRAARGWTALSHGQLDDQDLNAARRDGYHRLGYLSSAEFGYALSCYSWLRSDSAPSWATDLNPGPRAHLEQGRAYLRLVSAAGQLPTQRLVSGPVKAGSTTLRVTHSAGRVPGVSSLMPPP